MTDSLIGTDQKIPNWLIKIILPGKTKTAVRSRIKSRFDIMHFSTSDAILDLWFFSVTINVCFGLSPGFLAHSSQNFGIS